MKECNIIPEFECFDIGIVRSVGLYIENGMTDHADYNFVMGVASGIAGGPGFVAVAGQVQKA